MSSWGASGHNGDGTGGGLEDLDEDIRFFLAGADVWVVLIDVFGDLSGETKLDRKIPDGGEGLPHVGSEGEDHASKGVKSLEEVEGEVGTGTHNDTLDEDTSSVGDLIGSSLPTVFGHWDCGSDAISGD